MNNFGLVFCLLALTAVLFASGCEFPGGSNGGSFTELIDSHSELGHQACELLLPFGKAIAKRDYEAAYDALDPLVFKDVHARQFVRRSPRMELTRNDYKYVGDLDDRIGDVDKATFVQMMKAEEANGKPSGTFEIIEEWNFVDEGEPMLPSNRRYSPTFPFDKVVASVTIDIDCLFDDEAKETYKENYEPEYSEVDLYFNIFALVIKDDEQLRVAFVDFKDVHLDY